MDTLSHGLWSLALFKLLNLKFKKNKFNVWNAAFFGIFPDVFAFVIPYSVFLFIFLFQGRLSIVNFEAMTESFPYYNIINLLYNISHSIIIFIIVFILVWLIFKKPIWVMFGWLLHIIIDIPTHLIGYFPTPMFWPISNFKINGIIYWREPLFMIIDIVLLITAYTVFFLIEKKKK